MTPRSSPAVLLAFFMPLLFSWAGSTSDSSGSAGFTAEQQNYWAFQPVQSPEPPQVDRAGWVRNPIDAFILSRLEKEGIPPAPPADKITLMRRAFFDLTGLPPTPEEVREFLNDESPRAYENLIERLLASPHYGERWARHWLDLARYAESEGFKSDQTRPYAWRYRDYVIRAFNEDKPYDRFVQEQIAGDELWPNDPDARVATGFNRHYPDEHNARNLRQRRQEILNDITDTVAAVFTGMTVACARCHDHKFDPILQKDYYRLQAFFANISVDDNIPLVSPTKYEAYREKLHRWEQETKEIRARMAEIEAPQRRAIERTLTEKYPEEIQQILAKPAESRTPFEWLMFYKAQQYLGEDAYLYVAPTSSVVSRLNDEDKKEWQACKKQLDAYAQLHPGQLPLGMGVTDVSAEAPETHVLKGGAYDKPAQPVQPGFFSILDPAPAKIAPLDSLNSTGRRAALAKILTDPDNPLTARVMVNRIWHYHFSRGLVGTPSDFGQRGERPSHPELLDWLASEFVRRNWSIKEMNRLIMTSNAYRQSSQHRDLAAKADPANRWLWRYPRHRLEAEAIRDAALSVSGVLNPAMSGPSVFPKIPDGMNVRGGWKVSENQKDRNRRSIYVFVRRNTRYPMFLALDMPDTHESCARRNVTTSPIQALTLLNNEITLDWARHFAGRVIETAGSNWQKQLETAYRFAFSRTPDATEKTIANRFRQRHHSLLAQRDPGSLALPPNLPASMNPVDGAVLVDLCHMLVNANEFVYVN